MKKYKNTKKKIKKANCDLNDFQKNLVNHVCLFEVVVVVWLIVLTFLII